MQKPETYRTRLPRVISIATQVQQTLQVKAQSIATEIKVAEDQRNAEIERGKQQEKLIKQGFKNSVTALQNWLSLSVLLKSYQYEAAQALQDSKFNSWEKSYLNSNLVSYQRAIEQWVKQACDEFSKSPPSRLSISLPNYPSAHLPSRKERNIGQRFSDLFTGGSHKRRLDSEYGTQVWQAYKNAIYNYLAKFSQEALYTLDRYENRVKPLISFPIPPESPEILDKRNYLKTLNDSLESLENSQFFKIESHRYKFRYLRQLVVFLIFLKYLGMFIVFSKKHWFEKYTKKCR
ncbi:MAG: hypothetical protein F6K09_29995 [Merismopedia sp. SIO2A8]|nr:hypothetical protein [Merismopedia sp. SIO2A8]